MSLGPHANFIIVAYAVALLVVIGLVAWVELDNRLLHRRLTKLKAQGVNRRSEKSA